MFSSVTCKGGVGMIRTVICFAGVIAGFVGLVPFAAIAVLFSLVGFRRPMSVFIYRVVQGWALVMVKLVGCKLTLSGRENIPKDGSLCFVSNHGSIFDIVLMLSYAGRPFGFIAKSELLKIPFINLWIAVLGGLFIDRNNPRSALKTINSGIERIKAGGAMIIYPEGHRSRGQGLLPFRPGALKLATQSGAVIVPVALAGTYNVFEKNRRVTVCPVKMTFCTPIATADIPPSDRKQVLSDRVFDIISKELEN